MDNPKNELHKYLYELTHIINTEYIKQYLGANDEQTKEIIIDINTYLNDAMKQQSLINKQHSFTGKKTCFHEINKNQLHTKIRRHPIYKPNLDTFLGRLDYFIASILVYIP